MNYLSPDLNGGPYTAEEDARLMTMVQQFGSHWSEIAKSFEGRTDVGLKNRYTALSKKAGSHKTKNQYIPQMPPQSNTMPLMSIPAAPFDLDPPYPSVDNGVDSVFCNSSYELPSKRIWKADFSLDFSPYT
jgi:hypothetical protein